MILTPQPSADSQQGAIEARQFIAATIASLFARPAAGRAGGSAEDTGHINEGARRQYLLRQAQMLEAAQQRGLSIKDASALIAKAMDTAAAEPPSPAPPAPPPAPVVQPTPPAATELAPPATADSTPAKPQIKIPGGLLAAGILRAGLTNAFALWCAAYSLDIGPALPSPETDPTPARGWVSLTELKAALLPLVQPDRFYRLLRAAEKAEFVTRAIRRRDGAVIIYYRARLKIGVQLELDSLGEPVWLPFEMLAEAPTWKAALFAAVHVGRARAAGPIARDTLQALTGLPARTQRHYEARLGIIAQPNLCLSELSADHLPLMQALDERPGCFIYYDKQARADFIAWHLPNSYQPPATCARARSGMNRNINRFLRRRTRLINGGWQCAVEEKTLPRFPRIFWSDATTAATTRRKAEADIPGRPSAYTPTPPAPAEAYAPRTRARAGGRQRFTKRGRGLWQLVPGPLPIQLEPAVVARQLAAQMGNSE